MIVSYCLQVKVWLGDNADHYYVLSRFLLSRMLTVTKVSSSITYYEFADYDFDFDFDFRRTLIV